MKLQLQAKLKEGGMTALEVGTVAGAMILTKKFGDFTFLFKNRIAKDPAFAQSFLIKHQGGVRFLLGLGGAVYFKNPWVKLAFIGVAAEGLITEIRTLTTDSTGAAFFDKIGQTNSVTDQELIEMAAKYNAQMGASNPTTQYPTTVAGPSNPTTQYPTTVAGNGFRMNQPYIDLTRSVPMTVSGADDNFFSPLKRYAA